MNRKIVAVIVTYNRLDALKTTVQKSLAQDFHAVVVVNNMSTDGTEVWLDAQEDSRLQIIHSEANLGGAGGFHLGFEHAAFNIPDAEWLVAFDDDAYPEPGTLDAFDQLQIPEDVGGVAAAVYLPDGNISEMNRPSVNPFWHLKELITTSFKGREGFHVEDKDYNLASHREIDASSFVGFFLRLSLIREGKIGLPRTELFVYYDDIIYILQMRKAGIVHWFAPGLRFSHDCQTLTEKSDVYEPLWKAYFMFRNRLEMMRVASGLFYPAVLCIKVPKFFLAARHYDRSKRNRFLAITAKALWHGLTRDFSWTVQDVIDYSTSPDRNSGNT